MVKTGYPKKNMNISIHTIEARDNVLFEVLKNYFGTTPEKMFYEIQDILVETVDILDSKGISYENLRSALVPSIDKIEAGFIFDRQDIEEMYYGLKVMDRVLPLLDIRSSQSVLCGDLIAGDQEFVFSILQESLIRSRDFDFIHGNALYCVYMNNLSKYRLCEINKSLSDFKPYIGYIPSTFSSRAKSFLSGILVNRFLKHGEKVIMEHEDDRSNEENVNLIGYPFEENGMSVCSIASTNFNVFLSYKIERPVYKGFEIDTEISLNAISNKIFPIDDFDVQIEDKKYKYLRSNKGGKFKKARIDNLNKSDLTHLIRSKVSQNYIYNLTYSAEYNVSKFDIMLEIPREESEYPTKILVALEYKPNDKVLRVITIH